jgi:hypothetical protein
MNEKINTDIKSLKFIFNKNRSYIIPIVIILISIILFFQVVIPQFGMLLATEKQAKEASLKLKTLKANMDVLTNINDDILNSQLQTLSLALPLNKDFIGILNSVYSTAQRTGVSLGAFSFKIGDISGSESKDNIPLVKLSVPINSDVTAISSFVETISETLPLSEVYEVKVGEISSTVSISFYYKPLGASTYNPDVGISPVSQKGITIINQLKGFETIFPQSSIQ